MRGWLLRGRVLRNIATSITAIDLDPLAIAHANEYSGAPNVEFIVADLRDWLAEAERRRADHRYDVIIMNAAIDHFDKDEIDETLSNVAHLLRNGGIFVGCTIKGRRGRYEHPGRGLEFGSLEQLGAELKQHFPHVWLHSTNYGKGRVNYYWQASIEPTRRRHLPAVLNRRPRLHGIAISMFSCVYPAPRPAPTPPG